MAAPGVVEHAPFLALVERLRAGLAPHFPERHEAAWRAYQTTISAAWLTPLPYVDADLRGVTAPALILVADRDALVPLEDAPAMYRIIPPASPARLPQPGPAP